MNMIIGAIKEKLEHFRTELYELRFNLKTGLASQRKLSASAVEFPRINESYTTRKHRYVYGTRLDSIAIGCRVLKC
ncbi:carotenoid 9,10(9',10')-cleavage dioxygenase-like isoform X3 [Humulus lupulus]|uniref:carotenoid 9,10(9',10')-cleavage dioxygenase-like isoform X3 n=1 Tax=Humulus lupulus TaxID=3486 RepID=UPI002B407FB8|nr:carotenoid 9,10(9',10')-cleavage dioxygenase-like isoform X3 [Humulus lupulus]